MTDASGKNGGKSSNVLDEPVRRVISWTPTSFDFYNLWRRISMPLAHQPAHRVNIRTDDGQSYLAYRKSPRVKANTSFPPRFEAFLVNLDRHLGVEIPAMLIDNDGSAYSIEIPGTRNPPDYGYAKDADEPEGKKQFQNILKAADPYKVGRMMGFLLLVNYTDPYHKNFLIKDGPDGQIDIMPIDFEMQRSRLFLATIHEDPAALFHFCRYAYAQIGAVSDYGRGIEDVVQSLHQALLPLGQEQLRLREKS